MNTDEIEVGNVTEFSLSFYDAELYCFALGEGWRLPTRDEYAYLRQTKWDGKSTWDAGDAHFNPVSRLQVRPVRNIIKEKGCLSNLTVL